MGERREGFGSVGLEGASGAPAYGAARRGVTVPLTLADEGDDLDEAERAALGAAFRQTNRVVVLCPDRTA